MYLIHITGNRNTIEVSNERGDAIKKLLESSPDSDQFVDVQSRMFRLSTIREIEYQPENNANRTPEPPDAKLTPEQQKSRNALVARLRKDLAAKGIVGSSEERRQAALHAKWKAQGLTIRTDCETCGKPLPYTLRQFCSSDCMNQLSKV